MCITGVTKLNVESSKYQNDIQNAVINGAASGSNISQQINGGEESTTTKPAEKKELAVEHLTRDLETIGLNIKIENETDYCSDESTDLAQTTDENDSTVASNGKKESALENLAKNLESIGKYKELTCGHSDNVKQNDIIAFKVLGTDLKMTDYIIAMVEDVEKKRGDNVDQMDYDLILLIMGNDK